MKLFEELTVSYRSEDSSPSNMVPCISTSMFGKTVTGTSETKLLDAIVKILRLPKMLPFRDDKETSSNVTLDRAVGMSL